MFSVKPVGSLMAKRNSGGGRFYCLFDINGLDNGGEKYFGVNPKLSSNCTYSTLDNPCFLMPNPILPLSVSLSHYPQCKCHYDYIFYFLKR